MIKSYLYASAIGFSMGLFLISIFVLIGMWCL